jgi:hypothetical protein
MTSSRPSILGVEVAEALRDGLDALPVGPGHREQRLRVLDLARLDRVGELGGLGEQAVGLGVDVALVALGRLGELGVGVRGLLAITRHGELAADAVALHAGLARGLELARLGDLDDQPPGEAGTDVLHLAEDPVALGEQVELGDLGALVGDLERHVAGVRGGAGDLAGVVGGLDGDRSVGAGGRGLVAARGGEQQQGAEGGGAEGGVDGHWVVLRFQLFAATRGRIRNSGRTIATYAVQAMACSTVVRCE